MSDATPENDRIDAQALWDRLVDLEDGTINPVERDTLMTLLDESEAARRLYSEYFLHSEGLAAEARFLDEQGRLPVLSDAARSSRLFFRSLLAAAAVLILGGIIASVVMLKTPKPESYQAASTANARWSVDGIAQDPEAEGLTVSAGSSVQVMSGTLKLHLESGATMILQGPARVSFPKLNRPSLDHGWLWINSGHSGESFEVQTPDIIVRDIGTRFGVRTPSHGPTEVHLIEGKVEIFSKSSAGMITTLEPNAQGLLIPAQDEPMGIPLARDPFPELADLLAKQANYSTTIRGQHPAEFWRMENPQSRSLSNEIPDGITGGRDLETTIAPLGPGAAEGFPGFESKNHAAALSGSSPETALSLGVTTTHQGILFVEHFDGDETGLNGHPPGITNQGHVWMSSPSFLRNGSIKPGLGSATLGFVPHDGCQYTLDASFTGIRGKEDRWIAMGFANGQSTAATPTNRFVDGNPEGRAWMLVRGNNAVYANMAHTRGAGDPAPWAGDLAFAHGGDLDLRIILDTTRGAGNWTATWYAKRPGQEEYTCVRAPSPLISEMIGSIGIAISGGDSSGKISHFSLKAKSSLDYKSRSHLANGQVRLLRREGAVSFWVRRKGRARKREVLWAAGDHPGDRSMQASMEADGRIAFFMENGRYDVLMTSRPKIDDDRWHHLVATWSPAAVDLYLDGKRVARDTEGRSLQQGILTELRFGSGPNGSKSAPFKGQLDEIAVWDRPLGAVEVHHQFQSAKGN